MVEEKDMELTFSHKNINHTSTSGLIYTEHLLNAERRPQTLERARKSPHNWVGQKEKEGTGMASVPREGAFKKERYTISWDWKK